MLTTSVVWLVTKAIMVKVTVERVALLVNLVKEFPATSVKTVLINIYVNIRVKCVLVLSVFNLKLKFVDKCY